MFSLEIVFLGVGLAIDAGVVTFAIGLLHLGLTPSMKTQRGMILAGVFGFFQFIMLWLGSFAGYLFSFSKYGHMFHFVVGAIFILIAFKLIQESFNHEERNIEWGLTSILVLATATSIDALASGVSLGTLPHAHLAATEVGLITFGICLGFYFLSQFFQQIPENWLLRLASLIFIFLGGQIFWDFLK